MRIYAITCTEPTAEYPNRKPHVVFASTDYDAVVEKRANIDLLGECSNEVHPIRHIHVVLDPVTLR